MVPMDIRGMVGRIYEGNYHTLLHPKYESSGPCGFREEDFFPIVSLWELSVAIETRVLILATSKPKAGNPYPDDASDKI